MREGSVAVIRDLVAYQSAGATQVAPCGKYELEKRENCIGFCRCDGGCDFTLSLDAFHQYVIEGRIALRS